MKNFEVIKELGEGNFGKVELVEEKSTSIQYALKTVKLTKLNSKQKNDALGEVQLLASIKSPYVIKYYDSFYDEQEDGLKIVMELAEGDLQSKVELQKEKEEAFQETYVWKIAFEILEGLQYLHSNKIIHRDIKAGNIFIVGGIAKLGDLNVSKFMEKTMCSTYIGTPYYMSPEIWQGLEYSYRCDIWSLGCLLYEMCMLVPPFKASSIPGLYRKITVGEFEPVSETYSEPLREIINSCLTLDSTKRPEASELLNTNVLKGMKEGVRKSLLGNTRMISAILCPEVVSLLLKTMQKEEETPKKRAGGLKKTINPLSAENGGDSAPLGKGLKAVKVKTQLGNQVEEIDKSGVKKSPSSKHLLHPKEQANNFSTSSKNKKENKKENEAVQFRPKTAIKSNKLLPSIKSEKDLTQKNKLISNKEL